MEGDAGGQGCLAEDHTGEQETEEGPAVGAEPGEEDADEVLEKQVDEAEAQVAPEAVQVLFGRLEAGLGQRCGGQVEAGHGEGWGEVGDVDEAPGWQGADELEYNEELVL